MKQLWQVLLFLLVTNLVNAQKNNGTTYTTALGIKVYPGALTVKHFITTNHAIEALCYMSEAGIRLTGLYEIHANLGNVEGLKWYLGGGAHAGFSETWKRGNTTYNGGLGLGIDGILGIDYKIKGAPLNVSFDWQPSFNFISDTYFEGSWGGLGVRYTF